MVILVPLCLIKDLKVFAWTHIIIDVMILCSLITICAFATVAIVERGGFDSHCIKSVGQFWPSGIGVSIFTFEGIGAILPIKDVIENK